MSFWHHRWCVETKPAGCLPVLGILGVALWILLYLA